ncbi:hypothetical protein V1294_006060 [Bradyrhizobium sp. AZCC 1678]|uniref:hypothetical protein n=1 Tax=Bradyrhizobium sp. AZCC 1678 TaxID=3117030 RepID=UPI002FF190A4
MLSYERGDLRAMFDREMSIETLDATIVAHLHRDAAKLQKRTEEVCNVAGDVMRAMYDVPHDCALEIPLILDDADPAPGSGLMASRLVAVSPPLSADDRAYMERLLKTPPATVEPHKWSSPEARQRWIDPCAKPPRPSARAPKRRWKPAPKPLTADDIPFD